MEENAKSIKSNDILMSFVDNHDENFGTEPLKED